MKKVLFGIIAVSSFVLAAAPDLAGTGAVDNTNIFTASQKGKINGTAKIKGKENPIVKYVIFAAETDSPDSYATAASDVLMLPPFNVGATTTGVGTRAGFLDVPTKKVYVRRVVDNAIASLTAEDKVHLSVRRGYTDSYYTLANSKNNYLNVEGANFNPTYFLTSDKLNEIANTTGLTREANSSVFKDDAGNGIPVKGIHMSVPAAGEIHIKTGDIRTTSDSSTPITDETFITKWNEAFSTEISFSATTVIRAIVQ